jgi:hypothetical protein
MADLTHGYMLIEIGRTFDLHDATIIRITMALKMSS